jgi:hypothetical protein
MLWISLLAISSLLVFTAPASAQRHGEVRHSGTIAEISPDGRTVVLEELLAWQGPEAPGAVRRSVRLGPDTSIRLVERTSRWGEDGTARPGWESEALEPRDLKPGDFVTITLRSGAKAPAVALEVVRPGS